MESQRNRVDYWQKRWDAGIVTFHKQEVNPLLEKHFDKLLLGGKNERIFVPLCGKTLDMKWLADKGVEVVGLDGVPLSLEQFFSDQNLEYTSKKIPQLGDNCQLFESAQDRIRLYCGDMMNFSPSVAGTFDAIWDRASLVALNRNDVPKYVEIIKSLLKPGGRCLLEVVDFDVNNKEDAAHSIPRPPPPHPMYEPELQQLYEPECTLKYLDKYERIPSGYQRLFLITKQLG
ncbi:thiopurine S-methyltransferase [Aplysia californica]|uniref:thiopurine S-methyltransferase n=1 Tax=Aplysia californica TaxID=6500 RepID=A0ABM0JPK2_APLCA|nr:thiopurine S-methyltransferase [Aplysia californica]